MSEKTQFFLIEETELLNVGGIKETENHHQDNLITFNVGKTH